MENILCSGFFDGTQVHRMFTFSLKITKNGLDLRFDLRVELAAPDLWPPKLLHTCKPQKLYKSLYTTCYGSPSKENQL